MPRRSHIYTGEYPYHIRARANNREGFPAAPEISWRIFIDKLSHISMVYKFRIHNFTMMTNHYHLIGSCHEDFTLGLVMNWFQTSVSRAFNQSSGRINHVFGGRYKASLIRNPYYFAHVTRYIFQNPVRAGICAKVQDYRYSTVHQDIELREPVLPT